jgi:hypothetical protein
MDRKNWKEEFRSKLSRHGGWVSRVPPRRHDRPAAPQRLLVQAVALARSLALSLARCWRGCCCVVCVHTGRARLLPVVLVRRRLLSVRWLHDFDAELLNSGSADRTGDRMARPGSADATQQLIEASGHAAGQDFVVERALSPHGLHADAADRAGRSAQRSGRQSDNSLVDPANRERAATSTSSSSGIGSPHRVPTPIMLRKTGVRADGERTSSPHGTPPAWVSMGERGQWREDTMEKGRAEQDRLMQSLWARDFPEDPPEPLADGRRLTLMGRGLNPAPLQQESVVDDTDAAVAALAASTPPKQPAAAGVTVTFAQPLLAAGTPKQVVPRPASAPNPVEQSEAAVDTSAHGLDATLESEPFSPTDGGVLGGESYAARPQTADGGTSHLQLSAVRSAASASSRTAAAASRDYGNSHHAAGVGTGTGRVSAAVAAALMQGETAPPDPSGLDPMVGLQLLPTNTKAADIWMNEDDSSSSSAPQKPLALGLADDEGEIIGLVERIGEGRVDKREKFRRNKEIVDWQERAERFAKTVRATTAEVEVAMRRLQHMGGAEAGLVGEAAQTGKARSEEVKSLRNGREAIAAAVSRVRSHISQPQQWGRKTGRSRNPSGRDPAARTDELATLKNDISVAEAVLVEYKNDQRRGYEMLRQSEASLSRELKLFADTLDGWETESICNKENEQADMQTSSGRLHGKKGRARSRLIDSANPGSNDDKQGRPPDCATAEVEAFESFVDEFGPTGGWDSTDHSAFLRVWSRYVKTAEAASSVQIEHWAHSTRFFASACAALPVMSEDAISEHARWYLEYTQLLEVKRSAIAAWRERKRLTTERRRIKLEEQAARDDAGAGPKLAVGNDPETRKANAKKLEEWRIRKNAAKKKEIEERQAADDRARAKRQMEERREKARRAQIMRRRNERLAEKERQVEMLAAAHIEHSVSSRPSSASTIGQLQARDREFVLRKKQARIAKQQSLENARRLSSGARPVCLVCPLLPALPCGTSRPASCTPPYYALLLTTLVVYHGLCALALAQRRKQQSRTRPGTAVQADNDYTATV